MGGNCKYTFKGFWEFLKLNIKNEKLKGHRTAMECKLKWRNQIHPDLKSGGAGKQTWTRKVGLFSDCKIFWIFIFYQKFQGPFLKVL